MKEIVATVSGRRNTVATVSGQRNTVATVSGRRNTVATVGVVRNEAYYLRKILFYNLKLAFQITALSLSPLTDGAASPVHS